MKTKFIPDIPEYPDPFFIGSDRNIKCVVPSLDGEVFTITAGTIKVYALDGTVALAEVDNTDPDFNFTNNGTNKVTMGYKLDLSGVPAWEEGGYRVFWSYTITTHVFHIEFLLHVRGVP